MSNYCAKSDICQNIILFQAIWEFNPVRANLTWINDRIRILLWFCSLQAYYYSKEYRSCTRCSVEKDFFFDNGKTRIINDNTFSTKKVAAANVDLLITSPPYNVDIKYNSHNDQVTYKEYRKFFPALDETVLYLAQR